MPILLLFSLTASAAEVGVFATLGGDVSTGLRTGLDGGGLHTELAVELGGPKNAAHLGQRTYVTQVKGARFCIPGVSLGWTHTLGDDTSLGGYTLVAVGGYLVGADDQGVRETSHDCPRLGFGEACGGG